MLNYQLYCDIAVFQVDGLGNVLKIIPFANDNYDYLAYLAWLDAGNTPLPADDSNLF